MLNQKHMRKTGKERLMAQKIGKRSVDGLLVVDVFVGVGTVVVLVVVRVGLEGGIIVLISLELEEIMMDVSMSIQKRTDLGFFFLSLPIMEG